MGVEITMPQLSDTMSEGTILSWLKKEGDKVRRGDSLAEVETDKANLEIESFQEGVLEKIIVQAGIPVKVGAVIAVVAKPGEKPSENTPGGGQAVSSKETLSPQNPVTPVASTMTQATAQPQIAVAPVVSSATVTSTQVVTPIHRPEVTSPLTQSAGESSQRVKITPLARNIAREEGIDISSIEGTGDGGRILRRDVERALGSGESKDADAKYGYHASPATSIPSSTPTRLQSSGSQALETSSTLPTTLGGGGIVPFTKMRATIAERMATSMTTIPHFYTTTKVYVDELKRVRSTLKSLPQYEGLTYNHFVIRAVAQAMRLVPRINCRYSPQGIVQPEAVNVGIVTAVNDGLLIPVVKSAQDLSLADIVAEARALVHRARSGKPKPTDLVGGTFSVSNMGPYAVEQFTAIISPGQGGILAVSAIQEEPVVEGGAIKVGAVMRLTLSVDHRIIDGVMCGEFLTQVKKLLEEPILLLA